MRADEGLRVAVAASTPLARAAIIWLVDRSFDAVEIENVGHMADAFDSIRNGRCALAVVHGAMPPWTAPAGAQFAASGARARVVLLVEKADALAIRLSRAARGCSILDAGTESIGALCGRLRRALAGHLHVSSSIRAAAMRDGLNPDLLLTPGQQRVLEVIGTGMDDVQASELLGIQPVTVMTHRSHLMRKLGARHRGELIRAAIRYGYVAIGADGDLAPAFRGSQPLS